MERCDFSSIITTVRKYIGDDRGMNQIDLLYELFEGSGRCISLYGKVPLYRRDGISHR